MFTRERYEEIKEYFRGVDPVVFTMMDKHGYLVPKPERSLYANLIGVIIGQKIRFVVARLLRGKLYTLLGTDNFTPQMVKDKPKEDLRELGIERKIVDLIYTVTDKLLNGEIILNTTEDVKKLTDIKGIGPWTVNTTILMHTLHKEHFDDTLLIQDLIIRRVMRKLYSSNIEGKTLSEKDMLEISEKWAPYRGIVTYYLWTEGM